MMAPPPPVVSWTGCYLCGGGGYGLSNIDHNFQNTVGFLTPTVQTTSGGRGWLAGGGGGCDYQFGPGYGFWSNWVVGAFADADWMNIHRNLAEGFGAGDYKESSAWAVGGRIGYLVTPNVFTYWNGGYTQARFDGLTFSTAFPFGGAPIGTPVASFGAHTYSATTRLNPARQCRVFSLPPLDQISTQQPAHRRSPIRQFARAFGRVHARFEATLQPPMVHEAIGFGEKSRVQAGEISSAERRRFFDLRPID